VATAVAEVSLTVGLRLLDEVVRRVLQTEHTDKVIRKYTSLDEMKADEYRYWQSRPVHERTDAVSELTQALYATKDAVPDAPRLQRTLVRFQRRER
jgi:hypothetical protein